MKKYSILIGIIVGGLFSSCKYDKSVVTPLFNVTADSTTVSVGQPIQFSFSGDADIITFYSGEKGHEYQYRNRLTVEGGKPQFQFESLRKYGNNPGVADSTMQLLISSGFINEMTADAIQKATWTNITDKATWSTGVSTAYVPSGVIDLSDFAHKDSTGQDSAIYIAFRYDEAQEMATKRAWYLEDYSVDNVLPDSTVVNIVGNDMLWGTVEVKDSLRQWFIYATSSLMWGGNANYPETEDWLISQPLYLDRVQRDLGVIVKNSPTTLVTGYTFSGYRIPGTYTVVFQAINANLWHSKTITREITITVQ